MSWDRTPEEIQESEARHQAAEDLRLQLLQKGIVASTMLGFPGKDPDVMSVELPFDDHQWVDIIREDGELLQHCCDTTRQIRGELIEALMKEGYISSYDLRKVVLLMQSHDENHEPLEALSAVIMPIWEAIEPYTRGSEVRNPDFNEHHVEDQMWHLNRNLTDFTFHSFMGDNEYTGGKERDKMCQLFCMAKILPSIKTIYEKAHDLFPEPIKGFGIYSNDELLEFMIGPAVFPTREIADTLLKAYKKNHKRDDEEFYEPVIKPVQISIHKGIEILEDGAE